ncbi:hypothetical protein AGMMS49944_30410 [Spirochaetia bacterium]|nr:hypothetical protein AGMMS49944_30410 [Spirochaetia bacterium]
MKSLLTIKTVAPVLNAAEITIRRMLRRGELPHHKIGSRYLFTESDIEEYLAASKVPAKYPVRQTETSEAVPV